MGHQTIGVDLLGRVGLHTDEVIALRGLKVKVFKVPPDLPEAFFSSGRCSEGLVCHAPADLGVRAPRSVPAPGGGLR